MGGFAAHTPPIFPYLLRSYLLWLVSIRRESTAYSTNDVLKTRTVRWLISLLFFLYVPSLLCEAHSKSAAVKFTWIAPETSSVSYRLPDL